jgi:hypothetical protein
MELKLVRKTFLQDRTIGDIYINGDLFCQILEDTDRGLDSSMSLDEIRRLKVFGKTAIPTGKYDIVLSYSNRFKTFLPEVLNVSGYKGIRFHPGNTPEDTHGCLLPGLVTPNNEVSKSKIHFNYLFKEMKKVNKKVKITIEIVREASF